MVITSTELTLVTKTSVSTFSGLLFSITQIYSNVCNGCITTQCVLYSVDLRGTPHFVVHLSKSIRELSAAYYVYIAEVILP